MNAPEKKLGFWAGLASALFALLWFVTFNMQDFFQTVPPWQDLEAYAQRYHISRLTYLYPSLLLAISYIILLASLHRIVPENKKIYSLIALFIGIVYSVMASINYNIQAVAVRTSLAAGETGGIEMFLPDNPHSVFSAMANSYIYMSLSMFFAGFLFKTGRLEKWIRGLLLAQIITAVGQTAYSMFDAGDLFFILTSMVWVVGAPAAFILISVWIKKYKGKHIEQTFLQS